MYASRIFAISNSAFVRGALGAFIILSVMFFMEVVVAPVVSSASHREMAYDSAVNAANARAAGLAKKSDIMKEFHIANNGMVLIRGARVLSVSEDTIRVGISWGTSDFIWNVIMDPATKFVSEDGLTTTLESVQYGDTVTVTGMLSETNTTVAADFVRMQ